MGNVLMSSPCFPLSPPRTAKLLLWGGGTRCLDDGHVAGEIMFEFTDSVVCHASSFYLGRPAPKLSLEDQLLVGETYFVIPVDRLPHDHEKLTAASLASLSYDKTRPTSSQHPFEYMKGEDGRLVVKVTPEFIAKVITAASGEERKKGSGDLDENGAEACNIAICSTPELRKHYAELVTSRSRPWSPGLKTIKERKGVRMMMMISPGRLSPVRLLGLESR